MFSDRAVAGDDHLLNVGFQSPSGDSLFSDRMGHTNEAEATAAAEEWFQSPSGDSLFSDSIKSIFESLGNVFSFNPLAGIRCFLTGPRRVNIGYGAGLVKVSIP